MTETTTAGMGEGDLRSDRKKEEFPLFAYPANLPYKASSSLILLHYHINRLLQTRRGGALSLGISGLKEGPVRDLGLPKSVW